MTARRDPDQLIHHFLLEGSDQLHDQVYDAIRAEIDQKRQRVVIGPWRVPAMNKFLSLGFAAAALVVAVVAGSRLLAPTAPGGVGGVPSASPSVAPSVAGSTASDPGRRPGPYVFTGDGGGPTITVTIAAPGWFGENSTLVKDSAEPPSGIGMIGPWYGPLYVYGDPCRWSTTKPKAPASTVDEMVAALTAQKSRNAAAPVDVTRDGYSGKLVTVRVPDSVVLSKCDQGYFGSWDDGVETTPSRYHQGPGQIDEVLILDVDGKLMVFDAAYYEGTSAADLAEMRAILDSMTFNK